MNKINSNFLLNGDKFMPGLYLKQQGSTYSVCGIFTKHCERIQNFRKTGNLKHLYRNEWHKACLVYDSVYSDSKDLAKRTILNKIELMKLLEMLNMMDIKEH